MKLLETELDLRLRIRLKSVRWNCFWYWQRLKTKIEIVEGTNRIELATRSRAETPSASDQVRQLHQS